MSVEEWVSVIILLLSNIIKATRYNHGTYFYFERRTMYGLMQAMSK